MSGENPYAPPETTSAGMPDAPESFGWKLEGKRVWVEKFAQFPMIDPYSGGAEEVMTRFQIKIRQRPIWLLAISIILVGVSFALFLLPRGHEWKRTLILYNSLLILLLVVIWRMFLPVVSVSVFYCKRTLKIYSILRYMTLGICLSGTLLGSSRPLSRALGVTWLPGVFFVMLLLGLVWIHLIQRRLTCRRHKDGRFEIRGFHPRALELLAHAQQNGILPCNKGPIPEDPQNPL